MTRTITEIQLKEWLMMHQICAEREFLHAVEKRKDNPAPIMNPNGQSDASYALGMYDGIAIVLGDSERALTAANGGK